MKTITELLRHLGRPGVTELVLISGRTPMVKTGGGFETVDEGVLTPTNLHEALQTLVGEARASSVSERPSQWALRLEGLGSVVVEVEVEEAQKPTVVERRNGDPMPTADSSLDLHSSA